MRPNCQPPPTPTPLSSKKRKSLTAQNLTISAVHEKTFYEQIAKSPNLHLHVKVRSICIKYISVRGGGAGGGCSPPCRKKNSIIRAKLMYCSGKDTVKNILLFNILIYLSSSRIPQNGLHDILPVLYKVTSILVSK